jgi:glycosyltransferase involved in cell wall biosynthesis
VKVLVLSNLYPPHALGGYELSCQDVVRRWEATGHTTTIVTTKTRFPGVADDDHGVHRVLEWYWADHQLVRPDPRTRLRIERANRRRLDHLLDQIRPDVVSIWAMGCMSMSLVSLCVQRHMPVVVVVGDDWLRYGPAADAWLSGWSRRPPWARSIGARLSGVPTRQPQLPAGVTVAFVSDFIRDSARADGAVGFTTSEIVPPGIDAADFPARDFEPRPWGGQLLCVGRIEPRKGFDTVIRALVDLDEVSLRIVGPGNEHTADLMALARDLDVADRVSTDAVPRDQLAKIYADADAFVFPSRWEEPFGLVPLEAMSQATPVIATRRGGSAEFLVAEENCLEIAVDDSTTIADAVRRLAAEPDLRERLARSGMQTAARYDVGRYAQRLEALHVDAIRGEA